MRVLMIGDIIGKPGRQAVAEILPKLREERNADFVIANGENAAGGLGITKETALPLFNSGVDCITLGNHTWSKKDVVSLLQEEPRLIRPANYPPGTPGNGWGVYQTAKGTKIGVVNLLGRVFMEPMDCPFRTADAVYREISQETKIIVVDVHAEATSEKNALGWHLDGRASAVVGTHTHIQTSDERVLSHGTGFITDVGMTGPENSILGLDVQTVITKFITRMPGKFELAEGSVIMNAVEIEIDETSGKCRSIGRIRIRQGEAQI